MQQSSGRGSQHILFRVGLETYAVEVSETQEVLRYREPKKIPHAPEHVLGVINLRGQIIPIIGIREKFSLPKIDVTEETRIIATVTDGKIVGLVCDSVEGVQYIAEKNIELDPDFTARTDGSGIRGVARIDDADSVVFLLAVPHMMAGVVRDA